MSRSNSFYKFNPINLINETEHSFIQTKLEDGSCTSEFVFSGDTGKRIMMGFAISTFFTFFLIPVIMFLVLYGKVVYAFQRRSQQSNLANSRVIDSATTELTRTAIVVTVIFFIALGFDLW